MDAARWERVQLVFHAAMECPADQRASFIRTACEGEAELETQVLTLLEGDRQESSLFESDLGQLAHNILGKGDGRLGESGSRQAEFGPYRLLRLLGEGGMGVVYLAEREDLGSAAAVKILRDAWVSPARRERFASEQRVLAQLNHPSIARLFDAGTLADGTPWIVMEYVDGEPITEHCVHQALSVSGRLQLFRAVCEAVDYAHRHAIVHRDLKPSNILVKADGSIRLLDFGIAKQLDVTGAAMDHTRTGLRMMTPAYASPEQIRGETTGIQSDVYGLGVLLYELLTGGLPFEPGNRSEGELERMILEREAEAPSEVARRNGDAGALGKTAWADLDILCLTALHKDPERRYRSVEALIRDLEHYFKSEPLQARPDTLRYRTAKFVSRNQGAVAAAIGVSIVVTGMVTFFLMRLTTARNIEQAQAARTERIQRFMLNLFDGGDKTAGPAEDLKVVTLIDRGAQEARTLNGDPAVQAELYGTLGGVYRKLGKLDKADTLLQSALSQRRELKGVSSFDVGESEIALGLLRSDQAKLDEAERLVRGGLSLVKRDLPANDASVLKATTALGQVLELKGDYKQGIAVMQEVVRVQDKPGVATAELAGALEELGNHYFYAGQYDDADTVNQRVLAMYKRLYGEAHPKVAAILINLGAAQHERGHYPEAERYQRAALAINEQFYGPEHPETAASLTQVARALVFEDRFDEAEALLRRALTIRERVYGPVHPNVASTVNELGNIASKQEHYAEAAAAFQRMIDIYRTVYHDHHYLIGIAESNLATVYLNSKDYARAEPLFRDALARFLDTLSPQHTNVGIARMKLGRTLLREKQYAEAEQQLLDGYRIMSKQASPSVTWLKAARKDLASLYQTLGKPDTARQFEEAPVLQASSK